MSIELARFFMVAVLFIFFIWALFWPWRKRVAIVCILLIVAFTVFVSVVLVGDGHWTAPSRLPVASDE